MLNKNQVKGLVKAKEAKQNPTPPQPKYEGKGTRARLNTAAEKMFNSKFST